MILGFMVSGNALAFLATTKDGNLVISEKTPAKMEGIGAHDGG